MQYGTLLATGKLQGLISASQLQKQRACLGMLATETDNSSCVLVQLAAWSGANSERAWKWVALWGSTKSQDTPNSQPTAALRLVDCDCTTAS